jgi:hypothetical protein
MIDTLKYSTLERLTLQRPVERVSFIAELCRRKRVLDIGCMDETALTKQETEHWLHGRIGAVARDVVGIDNSTLIPREGLRTGPHSHIYKGNGLDPDLPQLDPDAIEVIVAGEFIEHIDSPLTFLQNMKQRFPGRELIISTPNGVAFSNALLAAIGCEAQHHDHLLTSTYKTLNTLCRRAKFTEWKIIPYKFYATEMLLQSSGSKRLVIRLVEKFVRSVEYVFPLRAFGYVVRITL